MQERNNCVLLYSEGAFEYKPRDIDEYCTTAWQSYLARLRREPKQEVWYDTVGHICFGPEQVFNVNPHEFSFFSSPEHFAIDVRWGIPHAEKYLASQFTHSYKQSSEVVFSTNARLNEFVGKHILVVGGGPSALSVDWRALKYDALWTCNKFYKNLDWWGTRVDLHIPGPTQKLTEIDYINFLKKDFRDKHYPLIMLEGGTSPFKTSEEIQWAKNVIQEENFGWQHTRYFSKLGTAPRQVVFAALLGAKQISFVGIDGYPQLGKHAFEKNKKHIGCAADLNAERRYAREFVLWGRYLEQIAPNCKFINLGANHKANQIDFEINADKH